MTDLQRREVIRKLYARAVSTTFPAEAETCRRSAEHLAAKLDDFVPEADHEFAEASTWLEQQAAKIKLPEDFSHFKIMVGNKVVKPAESTTYVRHPFFSNCEDCGMSRSTAHSADGRCMTVKLKPEPEA